MGPKFSLNTLDLMITNFGSFMIMSDKLHSYCPQPDPMVSVKNRSEGPPPDSLQFGVAFASLVHAALHMLSPKVELLVLLVSMNKQNCIIIFLHKLT